MEYLVANHLVMAHLAFRRNTGDESLVVRFAGDVGSPEVLRMLAVLTAADIHTFGDGLVLDHFSVSDPDFHGEPPGHRLREIEEAIRRSLEPSSPPSFRRVWAAAETAAARPATRVRIDNESSDTTTILEVFADDSPGFLYAIAKAIFEAGLSVRSAKIGAYLDQVVDAFHVTDGSNRKVADPPLLDDLRAAIQSAIATLGR